MDIKNINNASSKNLQLVSTFAEKNEHVYKDLLEFKYNIDGQIYSVKDLIELVFTLKSDNVELKQKLASILTRQQSIQELMSKSIDLLNIKILQLEQKYAEMQVQLKKLL